MQENTDNNSKTPRIRRSKCNHIYALLMKGKTHQEVQTITSLNEDTYFRYLRELRKQHGKQFIEQGDDINDEIALSS